MSLKISINDESEAEYFGCGTQVFKAEYDGRVVAAKVLTIYQESDHEESIKASIIIPCIAEPLADTGIADILPRSC